MDEEQPWIKAKSKQDRNLIKYASWILFYFGIYAELHMMYIAIDQTIFYGFSPHLTPFPSEQVLLNALNFTYTAFRHFVHLVAAYWLAKGTKKGVVLAVSLSIYEIVYFLVPTIHPSMFTLMGISFRIIFAVVIILIIYGRKDLEKLRYENWRPWDILKLRKSPY